DARDLLLGELARGGAGDEIVAEAAHEGSIAAFLLVDARRPRRRARVAHVPEIAAQNRRDSPRRAAGSSPGLVPRVGGGPVGPARAPPRAPTASRTGGAVRAAGSRWVLHGLGGSPPRGQAWRTSQVRGGGSRRPNSAASEVKGSTHVGVKRAPSGSMWCRWLFLM